MLAGVTDGGPAFYRHWVNNLCFAGNQVMIVAGHKDSDKGVVTKWILTLSTLTMLMDKATLLLWKRFGSTAQGHAMPCHAMPCHAMPCHAMPCHAMPCHAMPCHVMPCHAMPCHAMPCHAINLTSIGDV